MTDKRKTPKATDITPTITKTYTEITQEKAKEIMDTHEDYIILDVRLEKEYDVGHISGAVSIPDYEISKRAHLELPCKEFGDPCLFRGRHRCLEICHNKISKKAVKNSLFELFTAFLL